MAEGALPHGGRRMNFRARFLHHFGQLRVAAETKLRRVFLELALGRAAVGVVTPGAVLFRRRMRALDVFASNNGTVAG